MATTSMPTSDSVSQSPPLWPELADTHPLSQFNGKLDSILAEAAHDEIYGITLSTVSPFHRNLILQKFLRANSNDVSKASAQLLSALKWRKSYNPTTTVQETFSAKRFGGLGYVTTLTSVPDSPNKKDICTFNIYGAVTDNTLTFGDLDGFMRWRIALMELMIEKLDLKNATVPIPDFGMGADPYQAIQVHDYLNVSFLRQDPSAKAAAQKAIETFQAYYPETLSKKLFVNTPWVCC